MNFNLNDDAALWLAKILLPVILALVTVGGYYLVDYIRTHVKNVKLQGFLLRLEHVLETAVSSVLTTAKTSVDEGDSVKTAEEKVLDEVKSHIGLKGLEELETVVGLKPGSGADYVLAKAIAKLTAKDDAASAALQKADLATFVQKLFTMMTIQIESKAASPAAATPDAPPAAAPAAPAPAPASASVEATPAPSAA